MGLLSKTAAKGRGGDTLLGHLTPGDVVIPAERMTPQVQGLLGQILGPQLGRFTAGTPGNSINPKTGLPEFEGTGGEGEGEGPGSEGGTGGNGPGGAGTGGPGNGASAGDGGASSGGHSHGEQGTDHGLGASNSGIGFGGSTEGEMANSTGFDGFMGQLAHNLGFDVSIDNDQVGHTPTGVSVNGHLAGTVASGLMGGLPATVAAAGLAAAMGHSSLADAAMSGLSGLSGQLSGLSGQGTGMNAGSQGSTGSSGGGQGNGGGNGVGGGNGLPPMPAGVGQAPSALAAAAAPSLGPPSQQFPFFAQQAFNPQSYLDQWNQRQRGIGINPMTGRGLLG